MNPLSTMRKHALRPDWATARLGWRLGLVTAAELGEYALAQLEDAPPEMLPALSSLASPTRQDDVWTVGAYLDELVRLDGSSAALAALKWRLHLAADLLAGLDAPDWGTDDDLGPTYWRWMALQDLWRRDEFVRPPDLEAETAGGLDEEVDRATAELRAWVERQRPLVVAADRLLLANREAAEEMLRGLDWAERAGRERLDSLQRRVWNLEAQLRFSAGSRLPS